MRTPALVLALALLAFPGCPTPPTQSCSAATCSGCCDDRGECQAGLVGSVCGNGGKTCEACGLGFTCNLGVCVSSQSGVGGGAAGGSIAGGTAGGSEAGGAATAGGAGGGSTAGGSSGGGSTAGGSTAGGASGGGSATRDAGTDPRCSGTLVTCGTACVDLDADFNNCGQCGRACGAGLVCNFGVCQALPSDCVTGGGCAPGYFCNPTTRACQMGCRLTTDCPMGATCSNGACVCPTNQHACGQTCVLNAAPTSCGSRCETCAAPTGGTATCTTGTCGITCDQGRRLCGGQCAPCTTPANATEICSGMACDFTCNTGFHRCGDQCVANVSTNSCGMSCTACAPPANATPTCDGGACGFECNANFRFCSGACAACTTPANATPTCQGAQCDFSCVTGFHRCSTQCLSNTSPASCGTSCTPCPAAPANATETCTAGTCGYRCNTGFFECGAACCPATALAVGWDHACVRLSDGRVSCWGSNTHSQLALASPIESNVPVAVLGLGTESVKIAAGGYGSCAIVGDAGTYCWGENDYAQAGSGGTTPRTVPTRITAHQSPVVSLAVGRSHVCSVTSTGAVRCWGDNSYGQLAIGAITSGATAAAVGSRHSCAIVSGQVRCWGENLSGQLGAGDVMPRGAPFTVPNVTATSIAAGSFHTCAALPDAGVSCWGENSGFELGNGTVDAGTLVPGPVAAGSWSAASVVSHRAHTCVVSPAGAVWCWGTNQYGQLGDGTQISRSTPTPVIGLGSGVVAVGTGFDHSCALLATGGVKCWGRNQLSQLGDGTNAALRLTPTDVVSR